MCILKRLSCHAYCVFFAGLAMSGAVLALNEEAHIKIQQLQELSVPLQESGASILQIYSDYYQVNNFDQNRPLAKNLMSRIEEESTSFFSTMDVSIEQLQSLVPEQKAESCRASLNQLRESLILPAKSRAADSEIVAYGINNNFAYEFLTVAQGFSTVAMSGQCM